MTLVSVIFPELLTVPVNVIRLPAETGPTGGMRMAAMAGDVVMRQVVVAILVTAIPEHKSLPVAVETLREEQLLGAM